MARAAVPRKRIGKRIEDTTKQTRELYSLNRRSDTPTAISTAFSSGSGGASPGSPSGNFLETQGDTMVGPIAFFPNSATIASDIVDIGVNSGNFSSRVILAPQSGVTDDLVTISGAAHAGQLLFLQTLENGIITIKNSGNIVTLSGSDFVLKDDNIIMLQFDAIELENKWRMLTGGTVSDASQWATFIAVQAVNMSSNKINNVTDPTADQDAATKIYVDGKVAGFFRTSINPALSGVTIASTNWTRTVTAAVTQV